MDASEAAQAQIEREQQAVQQAQAREDLLRQICTPDALERLKRVKLVKRELVEKVEKFIEQQAMSGKLRSQVRDADIVDLLSKVGSSAAAEQKITIVRKRYGQEEDDDDDSDLR